MSKEFNTLNGYEVADAFARKEIEAINNSGIQDFTEDENNAGCIYRMVNGEKEWLNPPMLDGVAYRTTRRYFGKPIYVQSINFGSLPASGQSEFKVGASGDDIDKILTLDIKAYNSTNTQYAYKFPFLDTNGNVWGAVRKTGIRTFNFYAIKDMSGYTATVYIEYTIA